MLSHENYPQNEQRLVDKLFDAKSSCWNEIYSKKDVNAIIHQQRRIIAINYVDTIKLPRTSRILEIGCGAGLTTIALAKKGFLVEATDKVPAMIELTKKNAAQNGVSNLVHATTEDVHRLSYQDKSFDLIVALGVTPWLFDLKKALSEISRVLVSGGFVVLNSDNYYRLTYLLDPLLTPVLKHQRRLVKNSLTKSGLIHKQEVATPHMYSIKKFNNYLHEANLKNIKNTNLGFGPFTFFSHNIFTDELGVKIHQKLQRLACQRFPILRSTGTQYVVLAQKTK